MKEQEILEKIKQQQDLVKAEEVITVNGKSRTINRNALGQFSAIPRKTSGSYKYLPASLPSNATFFNEKPSDRKPFS